MASNYCKILILVASFFIMSQCRVNAAKRNHHENKDFNFIISKKLKSNQFADNDKCANDFKLLFNEAQNLLQAIKSGMKQDLARKLFRLFQKKSYQFAVHFYQNYCEKCDQQMQNLDEELGEICTQIYALLFQPQKVSPEESTIDFSFDIEELIESLRKMHITEDNGEGLGL